MGNPNQPTTEWGYLFVQKYDDKRIIQTYIQSENNNIFLRKYFEYEWQNWKQIYPDYKSKLFQNTGYICFTNGLIIMWTYWGSHMLNETVFSRNTTSLTIYEKEGEISTPLIYSGGWNIAFLTFSDSNGIHAHVGYPGAYNFDTNKQKIFIDVLDESMFDNINLNGTIWTFTEG